MSFIISKDDSSEEIHSIIKKAKEKIGESNEFKEIYSESNAIKIISPTVLFSVNDMNIAKFKLTNSSVEEIDMKVIGDKDKITPFKEIERKFIDEDKGKEDEDVIEILKVDQDNMEEQTERMNLDRINLLRGFQFGMDPFGTCIFDNRETENKKLSYKKLEDRLVEMFELNIKYN